jgi:hypothetical protein
MIDPRIMRHDEGGLCTLTLSRPDKLNTLDTAAFEELDAPFAQLERETEGMPLTQALAHEHYRYPVNAPDHQERIARFSKKQA